MWIVCEEPPASRLGKNVEPEVGLKAYGQLKSGAKMKLHVERLQKIQNGQESKPGTSR